RTAGIAASAGLLLFCHRLGGYPLSLWPGDGMFSFTRRAVFIRFVGYAALLYASFAHNVLCIPDSVESSGEGFRIRYMGYDSALVMNRMAHGPGRLDHLERSRRE